MKTQDLIDAWKAWDQHPANAAAARRLNELVTAHAGHHSNDLYRHVAAQRRAGLSIAAAIHTWDQP